MSKLFRNVTLFSISVLVRWRRCSAPMVVLFFQRRAGELGIEVGGEAVWEQGVGRLDPGNAA